ncbi:MAG: hypothetical protein KC469_03065 [Flavobacteriaceae bacterium]|nr:hypothetical protein [Flavobacteriaceae bacterium]
METGKTTKYFKYAIGEIVLVVIGILIALQINNWNEGRKKQKEEIQILKEIKSTLIYDLNNAFPTLKNRAISRKKLSISLLDAIKSGDEINDSINFIFLAAGEIFRPSYTAYKGLESKGIDIIQNDSIKNSIIQIYDSDYVEVKIRLETNTFANLRDYNRPFLYNNFKLNENQIYVPLRPKSLVNNEKFRIILYKMKGSDQTTINQLSRLELKIKKVIAQIDKEIQNY